MSRDEAQPLLGTMADTALSVHTGIPTSTLWHWRTTAGITRYRGGPVQAWIVAYLHAHGPCAVRWLARVRGTRRQAVYEVLRVLEHDGRVRRIPGRPGHRTPCLWSVV